MTKFISNIKKGGRNAAFLLLWLAITMPFSHAKEIWPTPEHPVTHVRVIKSERRLELWINEIKLRSYKISLGPQPIGAKRQEGDGRTPEGRYVLDFRKADSVAYKAMHVSYPSDYDKAAAKIAGISAGGSIMVHGNWNGWGVLGPLMRHFDWTNGCIGMTNADIDDMWNLVAWKTPIEILP